MKLSEDALRLASDELNRLAQEKKILEKQLDGFDPSTFDAGTFREKALFIENQIRWCMQGWVKANDAVRKRMLRRVVKSVIVTKDEIQLILWTSISERYQALGEASGSDLDSGKNILNFRRLSPPGSDRNLLIESSGNVGNGRGYRT